jgi:hypothetical protein
MYLVLICIVTSIICQIPGQTPLVQNFKWTAIEYEDSQVNQPSQARFQAILPTNLQLLAFLAAHGIH